MIRPSDISMFVAAPAYGYSTSDRTALSLFRLGERCGIHGIRVGIAMLSFPDIVETRNAYVSMWYYNYPTYTHLLFVDSDMDFAPDLIQDMLVFDKPLVGCFYRRKCDKIDFVGLTLDGEYQMVKGFIPVKAVGMGITLIRRDCITRMIEAYPQLVHEVPEDAPPLEMFSGQQLRTVFRVFDKFPMGYGNLSEDYSFCRRWTDIDGEIWANIAHPIGHAGPKLFRGSLLEEIKKRDECPSNFDQAAE